MFVWSSLASAVLGTAIAIARKARKAPPAPLDLHPIPSDCNRISVWTEHLLTTDNGSSALVQDRYLLQGTSFKVWSVLDPASASAHTVPAGRRIYHVTHLRFYDVPAAEDTPEEGQLQDRFYGTIAALEPGSNRFKLEEIGRGAILGIRKCSVGGASNGVETGEIHCSAAPVLNYRFEYAAVEKRV